VSRSDRPGTAHGPAVTDTAGPRPLRKDALRNRSLLVEAGRQVFAQRGLDASLDDVARQAGLGVGTAYRHFANKYELAQAIFADAIDRFVELTEAAARADDPWTGLVTFLERAADAQVKDRGLREVLSGVHDTEHMRQVNERISPPLARIVERAKQAGRLRADISPSDIGAVVIMLCTIADVTADTAPDLWRRYTTMLLDGLRGDSPLPVPPISPEEFSAAVASHKLRMARVTDETGASPRDGYGHAT
jgi:AcrR family transcriptional regulator